MFAPSNMLINYLNAKPLDRYDIIGALMGYINADPAFKTNDFEEAIQYVLQHGVSREMLFAEFDSEMEYEENPARWNEDYYAYARVYLKDNFCEKRIRHVKAVAHKLYLKAADRTPQVQEASKPVRTDSREYEPKNVQSRQKSVGRNTEPAAAKGAIAAIAVFLLALVMILLVLK